MKNTHNIFLEGEKNGRKICWKNLFVGLLWSHVLSGEFFLTFSRKKILEFNKLDDGLIF
jgi:hypothetical protein